MKMKEIIVLLSLLLCKSYAQLTLPGGVCVGTQVVFVCQEAGSILRWTVDLPGGIRISNTALSSQAGRVLNFTNDPGFGFEIHVLSSSSASRIISELRVTAVGQLNGVTVECVGASGIFMSTIQIVSVDPPGAPSRVMTTADQSQFTPSTASITLTWSASSGADNYTIMVTPLLPSGQSLISTTTTSLQLTVLYNEEYSINITAHNCAGSNSLIVLLTVVGCSPPSPLANGSISEYSSGAVGAMLTFQCDTGYMPQEEVTSTCLSNGSWVPSPNCEVIDCGELPNQFNDERVIIETFNDTTFGALITYHCEESNNSWTVVCGGNGEWYPDLSSVNSYCYSYIIHTSYGSVQSEIGVYVGISVTLLLLIILLSASLIIAVVVKKSGRCKVTRKTMDSSDKMSDIELEENVAYGPIPARRV